MCENQERIPSSRKEIEQLPGVGQYIASAVMLFELDMPEPLLDVNMARVLERYFGYKTKADIRHDSFLQGAARACIDGPAPKEANWGLLDLGALVCKARNPRCGQCPIQRGCYYRTAVMVRPHAERDASTE
jgi:A/G-specific adenine glycosylase